MGKSPEKDNLSHKLRRKYNVNEIGSTGFEMNYLYISDFQFAFIHIDIFKIS